MASKQTKKGGALAGFLNTVSYILLILGVSLILSTFAILVSNDVLALVKEDNPVILTLTEDTASGQVASRLKQEGVIQYPWVFRLLTSLSERTARRTITLVPGGGAEAVPSRAA